MNAQVGSAQPYMAAVYFVYGLAFFSMGLAVALELGRTSELRFARAMWLLAAFGLIHGTHEWIEMVPLLSHRPLALPIEMLRLSILAISFLALAGFGLWLLRPPSRPASDVLVGEALLCLVFVAGAVGARLLLAPDISDWPVITDVWIRYSLGIPAAVLASSALIVQRRSFQELGPPRVRRDVTAAAAALALYGIVGQLFVRPSPLFPSTVLNSDAFLQLVGVPIQLFRAVTAAIVAATMVRALRVFELETQARLLSAREETERLHRELQYVARDLSVLFETSRIIVSTLDLRSLLDEATARIVATLERVRAGAILLRGEAGDLTLYTSSGYGCPPDEARLRRSHRAGSRAVETGQPVLPASWGQRVAGDGTESGPSAVAPPAARPGQAMEAAVIAVPILSRSGTIGSLVLEQNPKAADFAASDVPFIEALARQIGVAIENVRLYEELQRHDALRGELLHRAIMAQEEERRRIARELHDQTGQAFTALAVGLSGVEQTLTTDPDQARRDLAELKALSMRAIDDVRQLVTDLRPSLLDELGLVPALRWYANHYGESLPTEVTVEVRGRQRRVSPDVEIVLFRIAQEALSNVARHAEAAHAVVRLEFSDTAVTLTAQDDGVGFDARQVLGPYAPRRGWGLVGIQERVTLAGGSFELESQPGAGTTWTVRIPLSGEDVHDV